MALDLELPYLEMLELQAEKKCKEREAKKETDPLRKGLCHAQQQQLQLFDQITSEETIASVVTSALLETLKKHGNNLNAKDKKTMELKIEKINKQVYNDPSLQEMKRKARNDIIGVNKNLLSNKPHKIEDSYRTMNNYHMFTPVEISNNLFNSDHLQELARVAHCFVEKTKENDVLLFLARSPLWIHEMFVALKLPRQTICIPYSGGKSISGANTLKVSEETFLAYKAFLKSKGLSGDFFKYGKNKRLVIIDRIESGASIIFFRNLLGEIDKRFLSSSIVGFGDKPKIYCDGNDITFITMEQSTLLETCKKHFDKQKFSLGVDFYSEEWIDWKKKDFNAKPTPIVKARQDQIQEWVKTQLIKTDDKNKIPAPQLSMNRSGS